MCSPICAWVGGWVGGWGGRAGRVPSGAFDAPHPMRPSPHLPVFDAVEPHLRPVVGGAHAGHGVAGVVAQAHHKHVGPLPRAVHLRGVCVCVCL